MGLDIFATTTGECLSGGYSRLHHTARYLALLFCGMPEHLDDEGRVSSMVFYLSPYIGDKCLSTDKLRQFISAVQVSGKLFPNLLLHSDCDGDYTKRGKIDLTGGLGKGNSVALLKELGELVNEKEFQNEKYTKEMEYTKAFHALVKKEIEEGKGIIRFC